MRLDTFLAIKRVLAECGYTVVLEEQAKINCDGGSRVAMQILPRPRSASERVSPNDACIRLNSETSD